MATMVAAALVLGGTPAVRAADGDERGSAEADVVVLPIAVTGELADATRSQLQQRLVQGLGERARAAASGTAASQCADAACWRAEAEAAHARRFVRTTITADDRDYEITAALIDAAGGGAVLAEATRRCEICGLDEVADTVDDVAAVLRRRVDAPTSSLPTLQVLTRPSGARVLVDGEVVGVTPLELAVAAGPHDVRVEKAGYAAQLRRIDAVEGTRENVELTLVALPRDDAARGAGRGLRTGGAIATAAGIAGVGLGIGLVVLDEAPIKSRCSGMNIDIEGHCKYRYDSLGAGIGTLVVGVAALATGVALLVLERKRHRDRKAALRPGPGGLVLRF
ncbi:MAG: PEGA domain-containing protein [Nannocystaceae bacterium]